MTPLILIDGDAATLEDLTHQALVNYGAYTSFGVEQGGVRGLKDHLARLDASAIELFGASIGESLLRDRMRQAIRDRPTCWLRVSLFSREIGHRSPTGVGQPSVMVGVFDSPRPLANTLRLAVQTYVREAPHLKHTATFGLIRARRQARADGFDDALFVDSERRISEGSLWNVGFLDGDTVIWPDAPMLDGVAQRLIKRGLATVGLEGRTRVVAIDDLGLFDGAFICNSATPACAVAGIGDRAFPVNQERISRLETAWRAAPPEAI